MKLKYKKMNLLKKGSYILLLLLLSITISCEEDNEIAPSITGLDFVVATISADGTKAGVVPTTAFGNGNILYTVDFGAVVDSDIDVIQTSGPMVTYEYPQETKTYTITVTASLEGTQNVSITKEHTVTFVDTTSTGGSGGGSSANDLLVGEWRLEPIAGSLGVGPAKGDISWWSIPADDVVTRACLYDDTYVFNADGTFQNVLGADSWLEGWQGQDPEACGAPVAPHDGSAAATYTYDENAGTLTIDGKGAFLGLAKVNNAGELTSPADAPDSITYEVTLDGDNMTLDINFGPGYWSFKLVRPGVVGTWKLAPQAGSLGVGPAKGDVSWWSIPSDDVVTRACLYDDTYVFNADGTFQNVLGADTWLEGWQGQDPEACGAPVAPHDGSAAAAYTYDRSAGTLKLDGKGAFLGLAKVNNAGELTAPADAPDDIEYEVSIDGNLMTVDINFGPGYWRFILEKQ